MYNHHLGRHGFKLLRTLFQITGSKLLFILVFQHAALSSQRIHPGFTPEGRRRTAAGVNPASVRGFPNRILTCCHKVSLSLSFSPRWFRCTALLSRLQSSRWRYFTLELVARRQPNQKKRLLLSYLPPVWCGTGVRGSPTRTFFTFLRR